MITEAVWHDDGHQIHLELHKDEVRVTSVSCPRTGRCTHPDAPCIVEWMIDRFGLEINVGTCTAAPDVPIAWTIIGNERDLETCQVWIIPTEDFVYSAWAEGERAASSESTSNG